MRRERMLTAAEEHWNKIGRPGIAEKELGRLICIWRL